MSFTVLVHSEENVPGDLWLSLGVEREMHTEQLFSALRTKRCGSVTSPNF